MGQFWFGNLKRGGYVPAPEAGMDANTVGEQDTLSYTNGGLFVGTSGGTHREYDMSWGLSDRKHMDWLFDYRNGNYGRGLLYFVDPFAENSLPPHWATPMLTTEEWPSLVGPANPPVRVASGVTVNNMPEYAAEYQVTDTAGMPVHRQLVLLIPSDHTLHIGFSGVATGTGVVRVVPVMKSGAEGSPEDLTLLDASGTRRTNKTYSGSIYSAVRVFITATGPGISTVALISGRAAYTKGGFAPFIQGAHLAGQGHTGLRYMDSPATSYVQAARNRQLIKTAAKFGEVGAWL